MCNLISSAKTYSNMLLSEFVATEDESSQCGWKGTLTFVQYVPSAVQEKTNDNASTAVHTGSTGTVKTLSVTTLEGLLQRAGISG